MKAIGLDIGTTTLCAALIDLEDGSLLAAVTRPNGSAVPGRQPWERLQDPGVILAECRAVLDALLDEHADVAAVGVSGQMHGMLYLDAAGAPAGHLRTWQDGRGNLPGPDGRSYAEVFARDTQTFAATGFGLVTLLYDAENGRVPQNAAAVCTIGDYVAMALCGLTAPRLHASNAASMGGYALVPGGFAAGHMPAAMPLQLLPEVVRGETVLGGYRGVPVCCAIGDNQASVFGSLGPGVSALVNVGTGSQVSVVSRMPVQYQNGLECRPYVDGAYLSVGAALSGGYAYHLLRQFFAQTARMLGCEAPGDLYRRMDLAAQEAWETDAPLRVDTRFCGTRTEPGRLGGIGNISAANFEPGHFCLGVLEGMCQELQDMAAGMEPPMERGGVLAASGNGIRNSAITRRIFARRFGMRLAVPRCREEAAYGVALIAAAAAGILPFAEAQALVQYE